MNRLFLLASLLVALALPSHAQRRHDTTFWQSDPDHVFFKLLHSPRLLHARWQTPGGLNREVLPLRRDLIGIGIYGLGLGIEAYFPLPVESDEEKERGQRAQFFDIQGAAFLKQISLAYSYQQYNQWYQADANQAAGGYFREFQVAPIYAFNWNRFSWKMPINQTSQQLKSAGSILLSVQFRSIKHRLGEFTEEPALQGDENLRGVWVLPGYGYTYTKKGWYWSAAALGGYGIYRSEAFGSGSLYGSLSTFARLGAGFNDGTWLFGFLYQYQSTPFQQQRATLQLQNQLFKFHAGYRFAAGAGMRKLRRALPLLKSF